MSTKKNKAVVVGKGIIGRMVIAALERDTDWDIVAVGRTAPNFGTRASVICTDLLDPQRARDDLSKVEDVTHYFYCGLSGGVEAENVAGNLALLKNSLDPIEEGSPRFQRVVLTQGGKYYGCHIGPHKAPSYEDDPRHLPPNFYYNQEDHIRALAEGKDWSFTLVRPEIVIGHAKGGGVLNTGAFVAVYAMICRELGVPMHFPGTEAAWKALNKYSDARMVGDFEVWAARQDRCAAEAYNLTVGSMFRWENIWHQIADYFSVRRGGILTFSLTQYMADKQDVWNRICERHGLQDTRMEDLANWPYADWVMQRGWDTILDDTKRISHGFTEVMRHEEMFFSHYDRMRAEKLIA